MGVEGDIKAAMRYEELIRSIKENKLRPNFVLNLE